MFRIFDILPSTNDYCLEYAKDHPGQRLVCIAHQQTKGRGRQGKMWESDNPDNLYLSYLRPVTIHGPLSLVVGVVIAQLLESFGIEHIQLKWPNDVLINGSKVAGILIEGPVIGIGLNRVKPTLEGTTGFQRHCEDVIASRRRSNPGIHSVKQSSDKIDLAHLLINHLEEALVRFETTGFEPFMADWRRFDCLAGHTVQWENGPAKGLSKALGINEQGGLILTDQILYSGSINKR